MEKPRIKIGHSFDIHKLINKTNNSPLKLGGIIIEHHKSLQGHSDADCVIHAIIEALLGACGLRSIGFYFPDTDSSYKDIDSTLLLEKTYKIIKENNFLIGNIDVMIYAQKPKLEPYIKKMIELLANILEIKENDVTIKATTFEGLDSIGNEDAIAASAVALIYY